MNINTILEGIIALGIIIYNIGQFTVGRVKKDDAGLQSATNTIQILKENIGVLSKTQQEDHDKIVRLEEQLKIATAENDRLTKIIENRNPDLEKVLGEIRDFMRDIKDANAHQTSILEGQTKRESIIDNRDKNLKSGRIK